MTEYVEFHMVAEKEGEQPIEVIRSGYEYKTATSTIKFQEGTIPDVGRNGVTFAELLGILWHCLKHFQEVDNGKWNDSDNADAMEHISLALRSLHNRTRKRLDRGVEGTDTP